MLRVALLAGLCLFASGDGVVTAYAHIGEWPFVALCVAIMALAVPALRRTVNLAARRRSSPR